MNIEDIFETAKLAFRTSERHFCGALISEYVNNDGLLSPVVFDADLKTVSIEPKAYHDKELYDRQAFRFYYTWEPSRFWQVDIIATVTDCIIEEVDFTETSIVREYELLSDEFTIVLPEIVAKPTNCGRLMVPTSLLNEVLEQPKDIVLDDILTIDEVERSITVKKTGDGSMLG